MLAYESKLPARESAGSAPPALKRQGKGERKW